MFHLILKYYGVDWAIFGLVLIHLWLLGGKKRSAFLFGMIASILALAFSVQTDSVANMVSSVVFFSLHLRAYIKWREELKTKVQEPLETPALVNVKD